MSKGHHTSKKAGSSVELGGKTPQKPETHGIAKATVHSEQTPEVPRKRRLHDPQDRKTRRDEREVGEIGVLRQKECFVCLQPRVVLKQGPGVAPWNPEELSRTGPVKATVTEMKQGTVKFQPWSIESKGVKAVWRPR